MIATDGIPIEIGPFNISIATNIPSLLTPISKLYGEYNILSDHDFVDFNIKLQRALGIRYFIKPQVHFYLDDFNPFKPLPLSEALPLLEWGMNWCIAAHAHQYLIIHSAVLAKDNNVLILPGDPGSGKSTLCAALCGEGWQLLSDELALINKNTGHIDPVTRPISLKNNAIDIIKDSYKNLQPVSNVDTSNKGRVAHIPAPGRLTVKDNTFSPLWIIYPKFNHSSQPSVSKLTKPDSFLKAVSNSFNYSQLGVEGFRVMSQLIKQVDSYDISYSSTEAALSLVSELTGE